MMTVSNSNSLISAPNLRSFSARNFTGGYRIQSQCVDQAMM